MDVRSAGPLWRGLVLAAAGWMLTACATEMGELQPPPATPAVAAPAPAAPAPTVAPPPAPVVAPPPPPLPPAPVAAPPPPPAPPAAEAPPPPPMPAPVAAPPPPPEPPAPVAAPPAPPAPQAPAPVAAPAAVRPVEVTGVEFEPAGQDGVTVLVSGDGPIPTYETFTLPDPPRLVVDIPNAVHAIPQPIAARSPQVTAVRSSQYRERPVQIVRIVLDLRAALPYRVMTAQNQLRVNIGGPADATASAPAATPAAATAKAAGKVTRVDVQTVRGRQQILIRTSGPVTYTVSEGSDPLSLAVDVAGATIEPSAARTVDLRQVTSPISRLEAAQRQTDPEPVVRVAADLRGPTRYDVRQTPTGIVVEFLGSPRAASAPPAAPASPPPAAPVAPASQTAAAAPAAAPAPPAPPAAPAAPPTPGTPGTGKLSMDFKDADINNLLRIIAEVSGMNVVAGGDVTGKVTVRLVNVEWQQALDVILRINGMGYEIDGNIIRVAPQTRLAAEQRARDDARARELKAREDALKAEREAKKEQVQLEPLTDAIIAVNYAKAADVVKNLDRLKTPGRPDVSIFVDDRTNKLIIRETEASVARMRVLLRELDRPTPQVLIEARIVEAKRSFTQSLGIEWGFLGNAQMANLQNPQPVSIFTSLPNTTLQVPTTSIPLSISMPATDPTATVGIIANSLFGGRLALGTRISAGESEQKLRVLSSPKVATADNQEAEIKQGTQVPYTTIDSSGRTVIAFQDAFIRLKVTPHITNDGRIAMKVEAEKSAQGTRIDYAGGFAFPIDTSKATTNILVTNGATIVLGGLLQSNEGWTENRVPWISKVPVLGSLFKSTSIGPDSKTELLIFLTPTILEEPRTS